MTIHIFNPEHDIALSMNADRFTPPHNVRQLRSDMAFLPSLWAEEGDVVIVDDSDDYELVLMDKVDYGEVTDFAV